MTELTVMVLRLAFFALLWIFVFLVTGVLRQDIFGPRTKVRRRKGGRSKGNRGRPQSTPAAAPTASGGSVQPGDQVTTAHHAQLVFTSGALQGRVIPLGGQPVTMGRAGGNDVVLHDDFASGVHARVVADEGLWYIEDLGSTNGTFVGDRRLHGAVPLPAFTPVRIGNTTMELQA